VVSWKRTGQLESRPASWKLEAGQAGNFLAGHASWKAGKFFKKNIPF
jgi:hypothetical protein